MPFFTTEVVVTRFAMLTPMGIREVRITAETEAANVEEARELARKEATYLTIGSIGTLMNDKDVTGVKVEVS